MQSAKNRLISVLHTVGAVKYDWEDFDWSDTEQLREYYTENMAEGHLSQEEEAFGEALFNELERLRAMRNHLKEILAEQASHEVNV